MRGILAGVNTRVLALSGRERRQSVPFTEQFASVFDRMREHEHHISFVIHFEALHERGCGSECSQLHLPRCCNVVAQAMSAPINHTLSPSLDRVGKLRLECQFVRPDCQNATVSSTFVWAVALPPNVENARCSSIISCDQNERCGL